MNHAAIYCKTLDALDRAEAVNALHQALMQLNAAEKGTEGLNNRPTIAEITRLLGVAGHIGFSDATVEPQAPTADRGLSFDGCGINGAEEYRPRLATFTTPQHAAKYGPLFESAPVMARRLAVLAKESHLLTTLRPDSVDYRCAKVRAEAEVQAARELLAHIGTELLRHGNVAKRTI